MLYVFVQSLCYIPVKKIAAAVLWQSMMADAF